MAFINTDNKEVQVKIVYYGPGLGGKTTNLEFLQDKFRERLKTQLVSIKTHGDRTLFFDFLPFEIGKIHGYNTRIQLYTVPGQVKYSATRRLVLKGVDGVVFVADSMEERRQKNILSLEQLEADLAHYNKDLQKTPLVIQYNKIDLKVDGVSLLSLETLENDLNSTLKAPTFAGSALTGENVVPTLKKIISITMASVTKDLI